MSTVTDEIKARIDLVELIGRSVQLRRSGSSFKGLCPFHQEKTPSFYVFPQSHTFVCFGCGKKGTAFDWLMEREHLEFGEALRTLAQVAGVTLPERREPEEQERVARLYEILAKAQAFYRAALAGGAGTGARDYLARRGLAEQTVEQFGLGYAPSGQALLHHLREAGYGDDDLVASGVVSVADDGRVYDFFRDRVLFPIRDGQGRPIAFGGRTLGDGTPKYLNSRDTLLFHKQETLFGFDLARKAIGQERRVVIVEGYLDAIMAHQHGYRNVVATLGTAVTERHLLQLRRLVDEIVLALDSDAAGQAATWRALQVADQGLRTGVAPVVGPNRRQRRLVADRTAELRVLTLPSAKDPDELIRSDPAAWPRLVQTAEPVVDFVIARLAERHDLSSARGKADAVAEVAEVLASVANPIEQAHYVQQVAAQVGVDEVAVRRAVRPAQAAARPRPSSRPAPADEFEPSGREAALAPAVEERVEANVLDEYALALFVRARRDGLVADAESLTDETSGAGLALTQNRALARVLTSMLPTADPGTLREGVGPDLSLYWERVTRFLPDVERFSVEEVRKEIERVQLGMRRRELLNRRTQVQGLLRDADGEDGRREWAAELSRVARALDEVEERLRDERRRGEGASVR